MFTTIKMFLLLKNAYEFLGSSTKEIMSIANACSTCMHTHTRPKHTYTYYNGSTRIRIHYISVHSYMQTACTHLCTHTVTYITHTVPTVHYTYTIHYTYSTCLHTH